MNKKTALITGIRGQDGTLLSKCLLDKDYQVLGVARPASSKKSSVSSKNLQIIEIDLIDLNQVKDLFQKYEIDECYHLAACHHESTKSDLLSLDQDSEMINTNFNSTKNLIHAILNSGNNTKLFYAGSSQMFTPTSFAQSFNEESPFNPSTFYGHTKVFSANLINYYRKNHGLYGVTGILFNHESPLRSSRFISRLITQSSVEISQGKRQKLEVRNPYGVTDWSSAKDFVEGYQLALQQETPNDLIFSSGSQQKVEDIIKICFEYLGLDLQKHLEFPKNAKTPKISLIGDNSKLKALGWVPSQSFKDLILEMLENDLKNS